MIITQTLIPRRPRLEIGPFSTVWRARIAVVNLVLVVLVLVVFAANVAAGDYPLTIMKVFEVLAGGGTKIEQTVVLKWRLQRALGAVVIGMALGIAGALTQSVTRNPLASPDILGISEGASAFAVSIIVLGGLNTSGAVQFLSTIGIPLSALLGALLTATVIWYLGSRRGMDTFRLVLAGIMITAILQAYVTLLLVRATITDAAVAKTWLTGSLGASSWGRNFPVVVVLCCVIPLVGYVSFKLQAVLLGDQTASGLGVHVSRAQTLFLLLSVVLTAIAVSAAGPIGFIAFVAPQVALRLMATSSPPLIVWRVATGHGRFDYPHHLASGASRRPGYLRRGRRVPGVPSYPREPKEYGVMNSRLEATGLKVGYGAKTIISSLDVAIPDKKVTTIIGPNGCGKSTLLRAMSHLLPLQAGSVHLDGRDVHAMRRRDLARLLGMLPQSPIAPEGLLVSDLVARGRHPHQAWFRQWSSDDEEHVYEALRLTHVEDLADRTIDSLSGGQRQRVWISMVLAQNTDILFLDEPTTYLDLSHSIEVLELVHGLSRDHNRTVVMVLHDLNLALRYSDNLVVMRDGALIASGAPSEVISAELLEKVFNLHAVVVEDPITGGPMIVPLRNADKTKAD